MRAGVMKTNDLVLLFKENSFRMDDIRQYIVSLLQKFEVALLWDTDNLLIPSLLPTELDLMKNPALVYQVFVCCLCRQLSSFSVKEVMFSPRFVGCLVCLSVCQRDHSRSYG